MEHQILPSDPAKITTELVKAAFQVDLVSANYQKVLQEIESIEWTPENIAQDLLAGGKLVVKKITDTKDFYKRPLIDAGSVIQQVYNGFCKPLEEVIKRKEEEKKNLANKIAKEQYDAQQFITQQNEIKRGMWSFMLGVLNDIVASENENEITAAERRMGTELSRKRHYGDLLPLLEELQWNMKPFIKEHKVRIKTLKDIRGKKEAAIAANNDDDAIKFREEEEFLMAEISDSRIHLQEVLYAQISVTGAEVGMPVGNTPRTRRTWWKWRVDNPILLYKKHPELVELIPNKDRIDQLLENKKNNQELVSGQEYTMDGLVFYQEKTYA